MFTWPYIFVSFILFLKELLSGRIDLIPHNLHPHLHSDTRLHSGASLKETLDFEPEDADWSPSLAAD